MISGEAIANVLLHRVFPLCGFFCFSWFQVIGVLVLVQITPYLSSWSIKCYIYLLRTLFRMHKHELESDINIKIPKVRSFETLVKESERDDVLNCIRAGIQAIVSDEVTGYFKSQTGSHWNLLSRNQLINSETSIRLKLLWYIGVVLRYFIILPVRIVVGICAILFLILSFSFLAILHKRVPTRVFVFMKHHAFLMTVRLMTKSFGASISFKSIQNRPTKGSICVANHTTPLDVVMLSVNNVFTMVGQIHGGFFGFLQWAMCIGEPTSHIFFNRTEANDRLAVSKRLRTHAENPKSNPILIFPEGTCINNNAVFMFKKGSFEVGAPIYPAIIKYDTAFGDPFWNSARYGFLTYILMLMTSWCIVCNIEYLEKSERKPEENPIDFAQRVKTNICVKGGLVDIDFDGQVKRQLATKWPNSWLHKYGGGIENESVDADSNSITCFRSRGSDDFTEQIK